MAEAKWTTLIAGSTKAVPVGADKVLILDSEDTNANKIIVLSSLPIPTLVQTQLDNKVPKYATYTATATAKDVVYMTAAGTAARARANALATMYAFGFATETKTAAACIIQTGGIITITGATFTPGLPVYISKDTAGLLTQDISGYIVGNFVQKVGNALTATDIEIQWGDVITVGAAVLTVPSGGTGLNTVAANSYLKGADAGALVPRTYAEVKTDLGLNNVDNTSNATERAAAATLTNKRITKRVKVLPYNDATITVGETSDYDTDLADIFLCGTPVSSHGIAQTTNFGPPGGTPTESQPLIFRLYFAAAHDLTWDSVFSGALLPGAASGGTGTYLDVGFLYSTLSSTWRCVAVA